MGVNGGHAGLREANEYAVLRLISDHAPVSKAEIVELSGLSRPTVLSIIASLEADALIVAEKGRAGLVGRAPLLYSPNPKVAHVAGVDLGGSKIRAAVADLGGTVVAERVVSTDRRGGTYVVDQIHAELQLLVDEAGLEWSSVRQITVGTPGVLGPAGRIELAGNIRNLDRIDVQGALDDRLGVDVCIENDVNLAAIGEYWVGVGRRVKSLALLALGTGVGLGIIIEGRLLRGARGRAGEIAYLPLGDDLSREEVLEHGAFELAVSGSGFRDLVVGAHVSAVVRGVSERDGADRAPES